MGGWVITMEVRVPGMGGEREVRVEFSSYLQLPRERRRGKEEGAGHVSASKCSVSTEERALIVHVQDQDQVYSEHSAGAIGADRP